MKRMDRGSLAAALFLIGLGAIFLVFNLIPGLSFPQTWPVIFLVISAAFFLPAVIAKDAQRGLAALAIPGSTFLGLGFIFLYNTLSGDWAAWAYAWLLIPASVGLGLLVASWIGGWGTPVMEVGIWLLIINGAAFGLFATLFGTVFLKTLGAGALILGGLLMLLRAFRKGTGSAMDDTAEG
jgi:hypothetical protein